MKGAEMLCESIPGTVLQIYVLLKVRNVSSATVGSVLVSALTTGLASKNISWDFDVDPVKRKMAPDFYGYIPNDSTKRAGLKVCMVLNSALLLLVRSFGVAMLMLVSKKYFFIYWAGDMALYLLLKVTRGDFHYWVPIGGAFGLLVSLMMRVIMKTITDFTGVIHSRHPIELGGIYWTVNMFMALVASFVSVWIGGGGDTEWLLVGTLSAAWVTSFGLILLNMMKKEYRGTFLSTKTGKQEIMDLFLKGEDDATKMKVLNKNKLVWVSIYLQVKDFALANWSRWTEEQPYFFTANFIARVPPDMIPVDFQDEAESVRDSVRKKIVRSVKVSPELEAAAGDEENGAAA